MKIEFPKEFYLDLENNDNLLARIVVGKYKDSFNFEADIVFKESRKIFKHVGSQYDFPDEREALDQGVIKISKFLLSLKH